MPKVKVQSKDAKDLQKKYIEDNSTDAAVANDILRIILEGNGINQLEEAVVRMEYLAPTEYLILPRALESNPIKPGKGADFEDNEIADSLSHFAVHPLDIGKLRLPEMRHPDSLDPQRSYALRMQPETLTLIAALNLHIVNNSPVLAYARAIGVGSGLLPVDGSRLSKEYIFTDRLPKPEAVRSVQSYLDSMLDPSDVTVAGCMIIARHGLEHLTYDHTLKVSDPTFKDRFTTIVRGSALPDGIVGAISTNLELAMRATAHPFGLAGTYGFARYCAANNFIPSNLKLRLPVIHHSCMSFRVALASMRAICALPIGPLFQFIYEGAIKTIELGLAAAQDSPWKYSPLFAYYGEAFQTKMDSTPFEAVAKIMPICVGYVIAFADKSALAKAKSIQKFRSRTDTGAQVWEAIFENYQKTLTSEGLTTILAAQANAMGVSADEFRRMASSLSVPGGQKAIEAAKQEIINQ